MSLSPHGSSAVVDGSLRKGLPVMLLSGVLAWVSGQSWNTAYGRDTFFELIMAFSTLGAMTVASQLVAGPRARPWLMASIGALGLGVPWLFDLAVERGAQNFLVPTLAVTFAGWVLVFLVSWATRAVLSRTTRA